MTLTPFETAIKNYLDNRAKTDKLFAATYAKENKSIEECCQYIIQEVRKSAKGSNAVGVADDEVYGLAVHYYDEDNIKVTTSVPATKVVVPSKANDANEAKAEPEPKRAKRKAKKEEAPEPVKVEEPTEVEEPAEPIASTADVDDDFLASIDIPLF